MISFFDPATVMAAYMLASQTSTCLAQPAPMVELEFVNKLPAQDHSVSEQLLSRMPIDTKFAHGSDEFFITKGLTITNISPLYTFNFKATKNQQNGEVCLWLDGAKITVEYAPAIYVAKEVPEGSCHHKEIMKHELRHANSTVITLNEHLPRIRQAAQMTVNSLGVISLPNEDNIQATKTAFGEKIAAAVRDAAETMHKSNLLYQQKIDTRQEYLRMSKVCQEER